ncbi:MAG TPA: hypothetical protein VMA83_01680 [Solirubrobacteraceae bacterium]|nr:hypothetical protein [Solirubrobacteraceae bacterium]
MRKLIYAFAPILAAAGLAVAPVAAHANGVWSGKHGLYPIGKEIPIRVRGKIAIEEYGNYRLTCRAKGVGVAENEGEVQEGGAEYFSGGVDKITELNFSECVGEYGTPYDRDVHLYAKDLPWAGHIEYGTYNELDDIGLEAVYGGPHHVINGVEQLEGDVAPLITARSWLFEDEYWDELNVVDLYYTEYLVGDLRVEGPDHTQVTASVNYYYDN